MTASGKLFVTEGVCDLVIDEEKENKKEKITTKNKDNMKKYLVTVTCTCVETWEVEAICPDEASLNYEEGEKISEDVRREVSWVQEISE